MKTQNTKDERKKSNLSISNVRQRCFKSVQKILGDIAITDALDFTLMDELDFIEIVMEVEKDFDCSNQINENDKDITDFIKVKDLVNWLASNVA